MTREVREKVIQLSKEGRGRNEIARLLTGQGLYIRRKCSTRAYRKLQPQQLSVRQPLQPQQPSLQQPLQSNASSNNTNSPLEQGTQPEANASINSATPMNTIAGSSTSYKPGIELAASKNSTPIESNPPKKVYPRNPIEDRFFERDRRAWEYYEHAY